MTPRSDEPLRLGAFTFTTADTERDFDDVAALNHRTFVDELGEYDVDGPLLVDKFHHKNTYFLARREGRLAGMIAVHEEPPFSIEPRLPKDADVLDLGPAPLEVRLLAVVPEFRRTVVLAGLCYLVFLHARRRRRSHLLASGSTTQRALYRHLGLQALGPAVRTGRARFVPMGVSMERLGALVERSAERLRRRAERG